MKAGPVEVVGTQKWSIGALGADLWWSGSEGYQRPVELATRAAPVHGGGSRQLEASTSPALSTSRSVEPRLSLRRAQVSKAGPGSLRTSGGTAGF